jgi:hypothetical protein
MYFNPRKKRKRQKNKEKKKPKMSAYLTFHYSLARSLHEYQLSDRQSLTKVPTYLTATITITITQTVTT